MPDATPDAAPPSDSASLIPLVVGAHLHAERYDRELAYRLRDEILARQAAGQSTSQSTSKSTSKTPSIDPLVCSDLWYLNDQTLRMRPTIAIGAPEVNAATAYLASRVPTSFVLEGSYPIQLDPEYIERRVCLWGTTTRATGEALEQFIERYLDDYLREAVWVEG